MVVFRRKRKDSTQDRASSHPADALLPAPQLALYGLQHLLIMYSSTVTVPVVVSAALGLSRQDLVYLVAADLLLCGIGTLLQSLGIWKIGVRMPMVIGAAYTGVSPMLVVAGGHDIPTMYGAILVAGIGTIIIAPLVPRLMRFFPPVVLGTAIVLIGLSLIPAGGRMITGSDPGAPDFANPTSLWIALVTVAVIVAGYRFLPPAARPVSVLVGIVVGTVVAAVAGRVDLSGVGGGPPVALPDLLHFGPPAFDVLASLSIAAIQIVLIVEVASQVNAVGEVVGKPVPDAALAAAVRADGVVTVLGGGVFQSFMYVTFTQNIGILSITKVYSRFVTATTGVFLVVLGFLPAMGQVVAAIPRPVLGAATLIMFGTIVVVGVQILGKVDFSSTADLVIAATALGVALVPRSIPGFYGHLPAQLAGLLGDGITVGIAVAFLLNVLFHHVPTRKGTTS